MLYRNVFDYRLHRSRPHDCQYWETVFPVYYIREIKYLMNNIFNIPLLTLVVILINKMSRLV